MNRLDELFHRIRMYEKYSTYEERIYEIFDEEREVETLLDEIRQDWDFFDYEQNLFDQSNISMQASALDISD